MVDSDDLRKGWLVNKVIDPRNSISAEDVESQPVDGADDGPHPQNTSRWGARGVSVSADDTLHDHHKSKPRAGATTIESTGMLDNDEAFLSDEDDDAPALDGPGDRILNSDDEWRDEGSLAKGI